jgi:hypothetical protein
MQHDAESQNKNVLETGYVSAEEGRELILAAAT